MPKPIRKMESPINGLSFANYDAHVGVIYQAAKRANMQKVWLFAAAQAVLETGHFKKFVAFGNYGNIKHQYSKQTNVVAWVNYHDDDPNDLFCEFRSWETGADAMFDLLKRRYPGAANADTIDEYTDGLKGWATSKSYSHGVESVYQKLNKTYGRWGEKESSSAVAQLKKGPNWAPLVTVLLLFLLFGLPKFR